MKVITMNQNHCRVWRRSGRYTGVFVINFDPPRVDSDGGHAGDFSKEAYDDGSLEQEEMGISSTLVLRDRSTPFGMVDLWPNMR